MTMKYTQLKTHWQTEDAEMILAFLDDLRDLVWSAYGEQITDEHRREAEQLYPQQPSDLSDKEIPF